MYIKYNVDISMSTAPGSAGNPVIVIVDRHRRKYRVCILTVLCCLEKCGTTVLCGLCPYNVFRIHFRCSSSFDAARFAALSACNSARDSSGCECRWTT